MYSLQTFEAIVGKPIGRRRSSIQLENEILTAQPIIFKDTNDINFITKLDAFILYLKEQKHIHENEVIKTIATKLRRKYEDNLEFIEENVFLKNIFEEVESHRNEHGNILNSSLEKAFGLKNDRNHWFNEKYAVVRVFSDKADKFLMAKEVKMACKVVIKKHGRKSVQRGLVPKDTRLDRNLGMIQIISYEFFLETLANLQLSLEQFHIILQDISNSPQNPIVSPYGTSCAPAKHAFFGDFQKVPMEMRIFKRIEQRVGWKVFQSFAKWHDTFNDSKTRQYFIETSRIEEIIENTGILEELAKYHSQENLFEIPENRDFNYDEVIETLLNTSSNFENFETLKTAFKIFTRMILTERYEPNQIHEIYRNSIRSAFLEMNPKYSNFVARYNSSKKNMEIIKPMTVDEYLKHFYNLDVSKCSHDAVQAVFDKDNLRLFSILENRSIIHPSVYYGFAATTWVFEYLEDQRIDYTVVQYYDHFFNIRIPPDMICVYDIMESSIADRDRTKFDVDLPCFYKTIYPIPLNQMYVQQYSSPVFQKP